MSEYWKSYAKKYCEICKTWMADNKNSIAIHEGGKTHKEKVSEHLKAIKKKNDAKNSEEQKYNKEMAAIERAAMAAMDKDLDRNPSLKRQYDITGNYHPPTVSSTFTEEKPVEKKLKKDKAPVKKPPPPKAPEPERPEQQSKIGSWQSIEKTVEKIEIEPITEFVDLQLPTSQRVSSKFGQMSVEQLQYELQKADNEFRNKGAVTVTTSAQVQAYDDPKRFEQSQTSFVSKPAPKWKVVTENSGFRDVEIEGETVKSEPVKEEYVEPEVEIPLPQEPEAEACRESTASVEVKKEHIEEKVVTLSSSSKSKNKVISFKKRKNDSANFKARSKDD